VCACDPVSFWRENFVAVVTLLRVFNSEGGNELSNVRSFITLRSREGLTSFNIDNGAIFCNEKRYNEPFRGDYFLRIRRKSLS